MRSFYKLDVLFILRRAIIKKNYDSKLSNEEALVYDAVLRDIYGPNYDLIDDSFVFEKYFEDYFHDWYYNEQGYLTQEELDSIDDLLIFRGLLHFKGKTVSLKELYDYSFGSYYKDKYNLSLEDDRIAFLEKLNGCLGEARVSKFNNDFIPRELVLDNDDINILKSISNSHKKISLCDKIGVSISTKENPLIFISGLEPCNIKKFRVEDGKKITFISISDLHLGSNLVNNVGVLDECTLKERLECFVLFKNKIIQDLRDNNVVVDGVFFVGDTFDALCGRYNLDSIDKEVLVQKLNNSRQSILSVVKDFNIATNNSLKISDDCDMVGFICGNHDNTLGRDLFRELMQEFGNDIVFLGDGSARIKVNDEYILFNHPNALDWGLPVRRNAYATRRFLNEEMFHFNEYFELCQRKFDFLSKLNLLHTLGMTPASMVSSLVDLVNENIRVNNPKLYEFYKIFITRGNGDGNAVNRSCFEQAMTISSDSVDPSIISLAKIDKVRHGFGIDRFIKYAKQNKNIREMLEDKNICFVGDYLEPTLSLIGHFHTRLSNGKRVAYAKTDVTQKVDGFVPIVVEEGSTFVNNNQNEITYSATICCLDIKDGVIDRIELEPAVYEVKRDGICQATRISTTVSSVYVRKKTL